MIDFLNTILPGIYRRLYTQNVHQICFFNYVSHSHTLAWSRLKTASSAAAFNFFFVLTLTLSKHKTSELLVVVCVLSYVFEANGVRANVHVGDLNVNNLPLLFYAQSL